MAKNYLKVLDADKVDITEAVMEQLYPPASDTGLQSTMNFLVENQGYTVIQAREILGIK